MTGLLLDRPTEMWWSTRRSRGLLVAALLPFLVLGPLITAVGLEEPPRSAWIVVLLAIAIGALQLRHSFAAARGVLPKGWPMTLLALGFLVYVPLIWFQWDWGSMQWFFIASVAMLLHGRVMKVLIITPLLGTFLACVISSWVEGAPTSLYFYVLVYWGVSLLGGAACLYGTSQLVRAVDSLFATRADLAEMTVGSEPGLPQSLNASPVTWDVVPGLAQPLRGVVATAA